MMLATSTLLISTSGLVPIILAWFLGASLILTLAMLNRRRIDNDDRPV